MKTLAKNEKIAKGHEESNNDFVPSKEYTFYALTIFYENETEKNEKIELCRNISKKGLIGFEICPSTGTPHLQTFLSLKKKTRLQAMWKLFPKSRCRPCYAGETANMIYCSKSKNTISWDDKTTNVVNQKDYFEDECLHNTWNEWIIQEIQQKPDKRLIHWFWSEKGKMGKTSLVKYLVHYHNAQFATGGKYTDIMNLVYHTDMNKCRCVIFTLPREHKNHISYSALESVKDGLVSNMKSFKNGSKEFPRPHVFVFANYPPIIEDTISTDRWNIVKLDYFQLPLV